MFRLTFGEKVYATVLSIACFAAFSFLFAEAPKAKAAAYDPPHCNFGAPTFTVSPVPTGKSITATTPCNGGILECYAVFTKEHYVWSNGQWANYMTPWMTGWDTEALCGTNDVFTTNMTYNSYPSGTTAGMIVRVWNWNWNANAYQQVGATWTTLNVP